MRATFEKTGERRGGYYTCRVMIEGRDAGTLRHTHGTGWIATPRLPRDPERSCVPDEQTGYTANRLDAARWMLDYQGLPASIADTLLYGWDVEPDQQPWIDHFLAILDALEPGTSLWGQQ